MANVNLGKYDQIMAVTQHMINAGLRDMFAKRVTNDPSLNNPMSFQPSRDCELVDFVLGCPQVIINYHKDDPNHVVYQVKVHSGVFKCFSDAHAKTPDTYTINDWYFAFPVKIGMTEDDKEHHPEEWARLNAPEDYSLTKLIIDLKEIKLSEFDLSHSFFQEAELKMNQYQKTALKFALGTLIDPNQPTDVTTWLQKLDLVKLGYVALPPGPAATSDVTFRPTGLRFQTYPWKNANGEFAPSGVTENSRLNALCYLEVTGSHKLPDGVSDSTIEWSSNFTPETDPPANITDEDLARSSTIPLGSFVMSSGNFMDNYIIPHLKETVQGMVFTLSDLSCMCTWDSGYDMGCNFHLGGDTALPDSEYHFQRSSEGSKQIWTLEKSKPYWEENDHVAATISVAAGAAYSNKITITTEANSNVIKIVGSSYYRIYNEVWRGVRDTPGTISRSDHAGRKIDWGFDLVLQSVNDGGLEIVVQNHSWNYAKPQDVADLNHKVRGIMQHIDEWFTGWNKINIGNFENRLVNDIGRAHHLVLPSSGVLWYLHPRMTSSGGFLCDTQYIPSGESFVNPNAPARTTPVNGGDIKSTTLTTTGDKGKMWK